MTPLLSLALLIGCTIGGWNINLPVAPAPRVKPLLKCEVRITGKSEGTIDGIKYRDYAPDIAEVTITNNSNTNVDIGSQSGPSSHLDLKVNDPTGADMKTEPWANRLSVLYLLEPRPYILKPGDVYRITVGLLDTVPDEKRIAGTYKVKAAYTIGKKDYESAWVEVKWPGKKK
jgi:hypothetical protein